jgi:hypothetical protein
MILFPALEEFGMQISLSLFFGSTRVLHLCLSRAIFPLLVIFYGGFFGSQGTRPGLKLQPFNFGASTWAFSFGIGGLVQALG